MAPYFNTNGNEIQIKMDGIDFLHTKETVIVTVYNSYIDGLTVDDIFDKFRGDISIKMINNIIDCYNYLYL